MKNLKTFLYELSILSQISQLTCFPWHFKLGLTVHRYWISMTSFTENWDNFIHKAFYNELGFVFCSYISFQLFLSTLSNDFFFSFIKGRWKMVDCYRYLYAAGNTNIQIKRHPKSIFLKSIVMKFAMLNNFINHFIVFYLKEYSNKV